MSTTWRRRGAAAAVAGAVLWACVSPLHALSYFATGGGKESLESVTVRAWADPARRLLEPMLSFGSADAVYTTYGRALAFVAAGLLAGLLALRAHRVGRTGRFERVSLRTALAGYTLMCAGAFTEYWTPYLDLAFLAMVLPGMLITLVGSTLLGIALLRAHATTRLPGWLLTLVAPLLIGTTALTGHLSLGLAPLVIAWALIGVQLLRRTATCDATSTMPVAASRQHS